MNIIFALLMLLIPVSAFANHQVGHDGVIAINDWDSGNNGPYPQWDWHVGNIYTMPENGCPASPSSTTGAVRGNFPPGPKTSSTAGGSTHYNVSAATNITTLYYGTWLCFSTPFQFHPIATKFMFFTQRNAGGGNIGPLGKENFVVSIVGQGNGVITTTQLYYDNCTYPNPNHAVELCTRNWYENKGHVNIVPGRWYWMETQATMNTVANGFASSHDGIHRVWVDDTLVIEYFDVPFRMSAGNVWQDLANTPILGGGGKLDHQSISVYVL